MSTGNILLLLPAPPAIAVAGLVSLGLALGLSSSFEFSSPASSRISEANNSEDFCKRFCLLEANARGVSLEADDAVVAVVLTVEGVEETFCTERAGDGEVCLRVRMASFESTAASLDLGLLISVFDGTGEAVCSRARGLGGGGPEAC